MSEDIIVIIGVGGMGRSIARRIGGSKHLMLADYSLDNVENFAQQLRDDGFIVTTRAVDVTSAQSVQALAQHAAQIGTVSQVIHTAGVSPAQSNIPNILSVNIMGVAFVLEAFEPVIASGGAGVVIASNAGHMYPEVISPDDALSLATLPAAALKDHALIKPERFNNTALAYQFAKRVAQLRTQAAAGPWGKRGARINSISPGVICTPMGRAELEGENQTLVHNLLKSTGVGRLGSTEEIASAVEFLIGAGAGFITGSDLLVDGGAVSAVMSGAFDPAATV